MDPLAFHLRFYDEQDGDPPSKLSARERRLRLRLPPLLRRFYLGTTLRESHQAHLLDVSELRLEDDFLVFASEQQGAWDWGLLATDLDDADPPLWSCNGKEWTEEGLRLSEFLRFFSLVNRAYERPCVDGVLDAEPTGDGWELHRFTLESAGEVRVFTRGAAVCDGVSVGGRDAAAVRDALQSLGLDPAMLDDEV